MGNIQLFRRVLSFCLTAYYIYIYPCLYTFCPAILASFFNFLVYLVHVHIYCYASTIIPQVKKIKAIYHIMNMFNLDVTQRCLIAECWCPVEELDEIQRALTRGTVGLLRKNVREIRTCTCRCTLTLCTLV